MGVVSHHGSCGLSCVKVISKERRGSNKREDNCHGSSLIDGDPSGGGIGVRETWMIYHLVVLYVKLMFEVTIYLLDQTWESSLVPIERLMLQHRQRWHLVSHTFLGALSWNHIFPSSSYPIQMMRYTECRHLVGGIIWEFSQEKSGHVGQCLCRC
jgi:hypothetical protein